MKSSTKQEKKENSKQFYCIIDTNVLVSAMLKSNSVPSKIVEYVENGIILPVFNWQIIDEYKDVLSRDVFGFDLSLVNNLIERFLESGIYADPIDSGEIFIDESDRIFYEIALAEREFFPTELITGNLKHFPKKPFVVSPKEMLELIENSIYAD